MKTTLLLNQAHGFDGNACYVIVALTPEDAAKILSRRKLLVEAQKDDPELRFIGYRSVDAYFLDENAGKAIEDGLTNYEQKESLFESWEWVHVTEAMSDLLIENYGYEQEERFVTLQADGVTWWASVGGGAVVECDSLPYAEIEKCL
jgi:hypothetical protein